MTEAPYNHV